MIKRYINILLPLVALVLASCAYEDMPDVNSAATPRPLSINAGIAGGARTRAVINKTGTDDEWSYVDFTSGDAMGFFSSGGKYTEGTYGEAPFENQELIYTGGTGEDNFRDPNNTVFSPSHMKGNEIYMYFPYSETITDEYGCVLRTDKRPDGGNDLDTLRCIDFLSTRYLDILSEGTSSNAALYGEFQHTFAELIIMRGKGFDKPKYIDGKKEWQIKAVLNKPVTGIRAKLSEEGEPWSCEPELVYDEKEMTQAEAMEWEAWLGANFYKTQQDTVGQVAWYVIVPTIGCQAKDVAARPGERTRVEYIELYDNDGNLQRVSSLLLSNANSKYVDGGWRYPMEISMEELVPTANPCQIVPWEGDIDLTDERKRGINDETEFDNWIKAYNAYLTAPDDENYTNALLQYGDLYVDDAKNKSWHFYVLKDLNLANYQIDQPVVPRLEDILDGESTNFVNGKFTNHSITGLSTAFIGTLTGSNAGVINFNFVGPNLNYGETHTEPAGIIATIMENGATVENCRISNGTLYSPSGAAGMVAGTATGSTIKGCTLSGFLISSSTYNNILGVDGVNNTLENNNASNVTNQNKE